MRVKLFRAAEMRAAMALIRAGGTVDAGKLADPAMPLAALAKAVQGG